MNSKKTFRNSVIFITVAQIAIILIAVFVVPLLRKPATDSYNFDVHVINLRTLLFTFALIKLSSLIIIIAMPLKWKAEDEQGNYIEFKQPKPIITALLYLYTFVWFVVCTYVCHKPAVEILIFNSLFTTCCHITLVVRANKKRMNLAFSKKISVIFICGFVTLYIGITVLSILQLVR